MRTHDHDTEDTGLRPKASRIDSHPPAHLLQAAAAGRSDVLDGPGILGLQRAVGNAGVGALLEAEPAQEQRSPVHDVIGSGGGSPLAPDVRDEMQGRLGHDFSDVRIHDPPRGGEDLLDARRGSPRGAAAVRTPPAPRGAAATPPALVQPGRTGYGGK